MLERAVSWLEEAGLTDVLLPFFLIFTVIYAIMEKSELLGKDKKNYNVILALVIAFAVIIPHVTGMYPPNGDVVDIINKSIPNVTLFIVLLVMFLLLIGLVGGGTRLSAGSLSGGVALVSFVVVAYIFGAAANFWELSGTFAFLSSPDVQALVVIILVFGLLVWFITKDTESKGESFLKNIGDTFFKKPGH